MKTIFVSIGVSLRVWIGLAILTGVIYPMVVTLAAQGLFPYQANGSLIYKNGEAVGSALVGQNFQSPGYFWGRPSATANFPYNGALSGASNLSPRNPELTLEIKDRIANLQENSSLPNRLVPIDLVTASGSGLDPHISLSSAYYQAERVARVRGIPLLDVRHLIDTIAEQPLPGFLGKAHVNVLQLNLALDDLSHSGN